MFVLKGLAMPSHNYKQIVSLEQGNEHLGNNPKVSAPLPPHILYSALYTLRGVWWSVGTEGMPCRLLLQCFSFLQQLGARASEESRNWETWFTILSFLHSAGTSWTPTVNQTMEIHHEQPAAPAPGAAPSLKKGQAPSLRHARKGTVQKIHIYPELQFLPLVCFQPRVG